MLINAKMAREQSMLFFEENKNIQEFFEWVNEQTKTGEFGGYYEFSHFDCETKEFSKVRDNWTLNEFEYLKKLGFKFGDKPEQRLGYNVEW